FRDDLYDQAVAIVCDTRQASVSYIQRRLQIGYNRSARMVEQMERDGIVGPTNGAKPRDVLAPQGEYLAAGG
ncbi:MAG TPA: DNA translocase FtsK, partial [Polyangia bacterium]|nr:DNA translocase FtsK [Polyangia bacterium]